MPSWSFRGWPGRRLRDLPTTVLVLAAEDLAFGEVLLEPE